MESLVLETCLCSFWQESFLLNSRKTSSIFKIQLLYLRYYIMYHCTVLHKNMKNHFFVVISDSVIFLFVIF